MPGGCWQTGSGTEGAICGKRLDELADSKIQVMNT